MYSMEFELFASMSQSFIKTHGRVSVAKKAVWHTSVFFTGTANLPFSTPYISTTTGSISMNFTDFMSCIYATLQYIPNFKEIGLVVCEIFVPENCPIFFTFSSSHRFTEVNLSQPRTPFPWINFFQIWHTYKALYGLS